MVPTRVYHKSCKRPQSEVTWNHIISRLAGIGGIDSTVNIKLSDGVRTPKPTLIGYGFARTAYIPQDPINRFASVHTCSYIYICIPCIGKVSVGFYRRSNNMLLFFGQAKHLYIYGLAHSIRITTTRSGWNRYRLQFRLRHDDTVETGAAEPNIKTTVCIYLGIVRACACVVYTHERCTVVFIYVRDVILGRRKSILDAATLRWK